MPKELKIKQTGKISKHGNQWIIVVQKEHHGKLSGFLKRDLEQEITLSIPSD